MAAQRTSGKQEASVKRNEQPPGEARSADPSFKYPTSTQPKTFNRRHHQPTRIDRHQAPRLRLSPDRSTPLSRLGARGAAELGVASGRWFSHTDGVVESVGEAAEARKSSPIGNLVARGS
jgi:hypothetical protein